MDMLQKLQKIFQKVLNLCGTDKTGDDLTNDTSLTQQEKML